MDLDKLNNLLFLKSFGSTFHYNFGSTFLKSGYNFGSTFFKGRIKGYKSNLSYYNSLKNEYIFRSKRIHYI